MNDITDSKLHAGLSIRNSRILMERSSNLGNPASLCITAQLMSRGRKVMRKRSDLEVTTKHDYVIEYKYHWSCKDCKKVYKRHSKCVSC